MNERPGAPEAQFTKAVAPHLTQNATVYLNVTQEVIVITGDKLELCLRKHIGKLGVRGSWIAPASILVTLIATTCACTFHDAFSVKADVWEAFFFFITFGAIVWFAIAIVQCWRVKTSLEVLIKEIKKISDLLSKQEN